MAGMAAMAEAEKAARAAKAEAERVKAEAEKVAKLEAERVATLEVEVANLEAEKAVMAGKVKDAEANAAAMAEKAAKLEAEKAEKLEAEKRDEALKAFLRGMSSSQTPARGGLEQSRCNLRQPEDHRLARQWGINGVSSTVVPRSSAWMLKPESSAWMLMQLADSNDGEASVDPYC